MNANITKTKHLEQKISAVRRLRRKKQLARKMQFSLAKSMSWKDFINSSERSSQTQLAFNFISKFGPVCQREFEEKTVIRQANVNRIFNDLGNQYFLIKAVGIQRSPYTNALVTFYAALDLDDTNALFNEQIRAIDNKGKQCELFG